MHSLLSLSAALQQLGVVLLSPQKRNEITRAALYSLVEALVDTEAKHVSETWHRSNLLFVRKMLDTWDPTWSRTAGTWQARLRELTSVRFTVSSRFDLLTSPLRIMPASRLNHSSLTYWHEPKYFWRSCSRRGPDQSIRLQLYCTSASPQVDRSTILQSMS